MWREVLAGKSLLRILMNRNLKGVRLTGRILDVGGHKKASYYRFLECVGDVSTLNLNPAEADICCDVTKPWPVPTASTDSVLCFNLLEHVAQPDKVLSEVFRVLKPGGTLLLSTPFLIRYHPDPEDFYRYTHTGLAHLLTEQGMRVDLTTNLGWGPFAASYAMLETALPRFVRVLLLGIVYGLDQLVQRFAKSHYGRYPLGYVLRCYKPL